MGRLLKNGVDYFPHDADASDGRTLTVLENHFGPEGYTTWFKLLEKISKVRNHVLDLRNADDMEFMAAKCRLKPDRLTEILDKMAQLEAIDPALWQERIIWCQNLVDRLADVYHHRKQDLPNKPDISAVKMPISAAEIPIVSAESTQSKVKESKGNNIYPPFFDDFWSAYPRKESKVKAIESFRKAKVDEFLLEKILTTLEQAKKSDQWQRGIIPHATTWLNQQRWNDEYGQTEEPYTGR